jgi:hypothetical protein
MSYYDIMPVDRVSLTMDPELGAAVREAAEREGTTVSAWLSQAAADRVRNQLLRVALDRWQEEDGLLTEAEIEEARESLGLARSSRASGT